MPCILRDLARILLALNYYTERYLELLPSAFSSSKPIIFNSGKSPKTDLKANQFPFPFYLFSYILSPYSHISFEEARIFDC